MKNKPTITSKCTANKYAAPNETIAEFSFPDGSGGLISLIVLDNGTNLVQTYRVDSNIVVKKGSS